MPVYTFHHFAAAGRQNAASCILTACCCCCWTYGVRHIRCKEFNVLYVTPVKPHWKLITMLMLRYDARLRIRVKKLHPVRGQQKCRNAESIIIFF